MQVVLDHFPHAWGADNYLMRNLPSVLHQAGFAKTEPLNLHTVVDTDAKSYGFQVGMRAVDMYGKAGIIRYISYVPSMSHIFRYLFSNTLTQALRDELTLRVERGTFQCVLSYASVTAFN